jgi:hypothetical protein
MKRRRVLVVLGTSLTVAGCLSDGSTENSTDPDSPDNRDTLFTVATGRDEVNAHVLTVQNTDTTSRTVQLHITDVATDEALLDRSYSLASGEKIRGELRGPAEYVVRITLPEIGSEAIITVDYFDTCNEYETIATIARDRTITSETLRTDVECGSE